MRKKFIVAAIAMTAVVAANLFVISAKEGNVKCQNLLSSSFLLNKIAYANDPGGYIPTNTLHGPRYVEQVSCSNYANGEVTKIRYQFSNTSAKARRLKSDFSLEVGASAPFSWVNVEGEASAKWGANKESENNLANSFSGEWVVDIRSARPFIVVCDTESNQGCIEDTDPCTSMYSRAYMKFLDFYYSN